MSMDPAALVVGVDFGTLSGRAVVVRVEDGAELGSAVTRLPPRRGRPPPARQRPRAAAGLGAAGARRLRGGTAHRRARRAGRRGRRPGPRGGDRHRLHRLHDGADHADGTPLCELAEFADEPHAYVKLWRHHAAQPQADRINELAEKRHEPWLPRYGGLISSEWEFAKGLQMLQEAPAVYAAMRHWVEAADWIVWQLTGQLRPQRLHRRLQGHPAGRGLPVAGVLPRAGSRLRALRRREAGAPARASSATAPAA